MLEDVGDFFAGFFGVIDGDVLALLGAEGGIAADGFAGIHGGMPGNFEGFLCAIGGFSGDGFGALSLVFGPAFVWVGGFISPSPPRLGRLSSTFPSCLDRYSSPLL